MKKKTNRNSTAKPLPGGLGGGHPQLRSNNTPFPFPPLPLVVMLMGHGSSIPIELAVLEWFPASLSWEWSFVLSECCQATRPK